MSPRTPIVAVVVVFASCGAALPQDAGKGAVVFKVCATCHSIGPGATNKIGPELNGLDGRHCGAAPGYDYSSANVGSGIVWNEKTFKRYVRNPMAMIPGTKMLFAGIDSPRDIDDLWAYVSQFDAKGNIKVKKELATSAGSPPAPRPPPQ